MSFILWCIYNYEHTFVALASAVEDDDMGSTSTNISRNFFMFTMLPAVAINCQSGTLLTCI